MSEEYIVETELNETDKISYSVDPESPIYFRFYTGANMILEIVSDRINPSNTGKSGSNLKMILREGRDDFSFNAETERNENLTAAGVIDLTKVVRLSLQNAASVAGLMITTEAMVSEKADKKSKIIPPYKDNRSWRKIT